VRNIWWCILDFTIYASLLAGIMALWYWLITLGFDPSIYVTYYIPWLGVRKKVPVEGKDE